MYFCCSSICPWVPTCNPYVSLSLHNCSFCALDCTIFFIPRRYQFPCFDNVYVMLQIYNYWMVTCSYYIHSLRGLRNP